MKKRSPNPKQLIGLILILSGLIMMLGAAAIPQSVNVSGVVRYAVAVAGLMDLLFGVAFLMAGRTPH